MIRRMLPETHDWFVQSVLFWNAYKAFGPELEENLDAGDGEVEEVAL
jgi:hypothetical protein